jgi:ATP-dependent Lon protease
MTEFEDISLEEMISDGFDIVAQKSTLMILRKQKKFRAKIFPILPVRNMVMFLML